MHSIPERGGSTAQRKRLVLGITTEVTLIELSLKIL
jgi:hypothetical protein